MTAPRPKPPAAMPVFGDAYLSDTHHLTLEEHGAYLKLLLIAWRTADCALPADDKRLAMMLGITPKKWAKLKPVVMAFWTFEGGKWRQKRQTEVRRFVEQKSLQSSEAAEARWNKQRPKNKRNGASGRISKRKSARISGGDASQTQENPPIVPQSKSWPIADDWRPEPFGDGTACRRIVDGWSEDELLLQVERFIAHHQAVGSRMDWQAAWKTWVLKAEQFAQRDRKASGSKPAKTYADVVLEEEERRRRRERAEPVTDK